MNLLDTGRLTIRSSNKGKPDGGGVEMFPFTPCCSKAEHQQVALHYHGALMSCPLTTALFCSGNVLQMLINTWRHNGGVNM